MITLLAKLFIKEESSLPPQELRQRYGILSGAAGILLNLFLFTGKFIAGTISHSIAITADAFNNLSDAGSSIVTLIGFKLAAAKPDPEHPFGHGRMEYISGLVVAASILIMGFELLRTSFDKILHPQEIDCSVLTILILIISILVKLYMFLYNNQIGKKIDSAAMRATAMDSISDTFATFVVLASTLIAAFSGLKIDGYCGVLVALFIFYAGISAARETLNPLLGQPADPEFVQQIEELVMSYPMICGIHDLVVHDYGPGRVMISLHAEVPASLDILEIHDTIDQIEHKLKHTLFCEAVIHMDPITTDDEETAQARAQVLSIIHHMDSSITMHDFRMVKGNTHTNLIFDIVVPFGYRQSDDTVTSQIQQQIHQELGPQYFCVIDVDKSYVK